MFGGRGDYAFVTVRVTHGQLAPCVCCSKFVYMICSMSCQVSLTPTWSGSEGRCFDGSKCVITKCDYHIKPCGIPVSIYPGGWTLDLSKKSLDGSRELNKFNRGRDDRWVVAAYASGKMFHAAEVGGHAAMKQTLCIRLVPTLPCKIRL